MMIISLIIISFMIILLSVIISYVYIKTYVSNNCNKCYNECYNKDNYNDNIQTLALAQEHNNLNTKLYNGQRTNLIVYPWLNSTRFTRNMSYDIRGDVF